MNGSHLIVTQSGSPAVTWDLSMEGGKLAGTQKRGEAKDGDVAGVRAPKLDRKMPKSWTKPEPLFNGKDLTGWKALVGDPPSRAKMTSDQLAAAQERPIRRCATTGKW